MKAFFVFIILVFSLSVSAQDNIILHNGDVIESRVMDYNDYSIIYQKWDEIDGPNYILPIEEVFMILYEDGRKKIFKSDIGTDTISEVNVNIEPTTDFLLDDLCTTAIKDADENYRATKDFIVPAVATIFMPPFGLYGAIYYSVSQPPDKILNYPEPLLMENEEYKKCYVKTVKEKRSFNAWAGFGTAVMFFVGIYAVGYIQSQ